MMMKMFMPVRTLALFELSSGIILCYFQSMPKMPEGEKKEESAESLAEKKEQVSKIGFV